MDGTLTIAVHDFLYIRRMLEIPTHADILGHLASLPSAEAVQKHAWLLEHERQLALNQRLGRSSWLSTCMNANAISPFSPAMRKN